MNKTDIKKRIADSLKNENEIVKIIIFGSFNRKTLPNDIDIAIVQSSNKDYLPLAMKYRKLLRSISREISMDVFPVIENNDNDFFKDEVASGEVIYNRELITI